MFNNIIMSILILLALHRGCGTQEKKMWMSFVICDF